MNLVSRSDAVIPLPGFPSSMDKGIAARVAGMRRFGIFEGDMAVDFRGDNIPELVTRILELCTVDPDGVLPAGFLRDVSVGKRLECLLRLAANEPDASFNFPFRCAGCGQELEMDLTVDEIAEMQREADLTETVEVVVNGKSYSFRKPNGRDQENWAQTVFRDEREAAAAMIGTLAADPGIADGLGAKELDLIDEAMDEADPLINFLCRIGCAECGTPNEISIDLCDTALQMLSRLQRQLVVMVHKLASHYHWSEREIFEIPHWRRKEYLELIAEGR